MGCLSISPLICLCPISEIFFVVLYFFEGNVFPHGDWFDLRDWLVVYLLISLMFPSLLLVSLFAYMFVVLLCSLRICLKFTLPTLSQMLLICLYILFMAEFDGYFLFAIASMIIAKSPIIKGSFMALFLWSLSPLTGCMLLLYCLLFLPIPIRRRPPLSRMGLLWYLLHLLSLGCFYIPHQRTRSNFFYFLSNLWVLLYLSGFSSSELSEYARDFFFIVVYCCFTDPVSLFLLKEVVINFSSAFII